MSILTRNSRVVMLALLSVLPVQAFAQGGPPGMGGPAKVVVGEAHEGVLSPQAEYRGSVYFKEVSDVATEVNGKVTAVRFEEGDHVRRGQLLLQLDDDLLQMDLGAVRAMLDRDRTELEDAIVRFDRAKDLVDQGLATPEQYDEYRFDVQSLRFQVIARQAELERIEAVIGKGSIYAPFDGIVLDRSSEVGEWKSAGDTIGTIALESEYRVVVDVPETTVVWVKKDEQVELLIGGEKIVGTVTTVIPQGDIATRTFPVKIRLESDRPLLEGMTVIARLPVGERVSSLMVSRDALLLKFGGNVVFTVRDGVAMQHFVDVIGYDGMYAGISSNELSATDTFIVTGHERLRSGDRVEVVGGKTPPVTNRDSDD